MFTPFIIDISAPTEVKETVETLAITEVKETVKMSNDETVECGSSETSDVVGDQND